MAPLPPESTRRYYLTYVVDTKEHTMVMRTEDTVDEVQATAALDAFISAFAGELQGISITKLEVSNSGSNVRLPAAWGGAASYGNGFSNVVNAPRFFSVTGKSGEGRDFRVEVFGAASTVDNNYRYTDAELSIVSDVIAALEADPQVWLTISGNKPIYNSYLNVAYSAYWQRQLRSG